MPPIAYSEFIRKNNVVRHYCCLHCMCNLSSHNKIVTQAWQICFTKVKLC